MFRAYQEQFDRWVAVKVLTITLDDDGAQRRFLRECRLAGRLSQHPNIVTVYDAGISPDGRPYLAMEMFEQGSLAVAVATPGGLDVASTLRTGIALSGALETAHRAGIVHRDVTPGNVLMSSYGQPVLTDFGLSVLVEQRDPTIGGDALTPFHTAPELIEGGPVSPASDVYALASTLYAVLEGRAPHQDPSNPELGPLLRRIVEQDAPRLSRPDVPSALADVFAAALAHDPRRRPRSALVLAHAFQAVQRTVGADATNPVVLDIPPPAPDLTPGPPESAPEPGSTTADPPDRAQPVAEAAETMPRHRIDAAAGAAAPAAKPPPPPPAPAKSSPAPAPPPPPAPRLPSGPADDVIVVDLTDEPGHDQTILRAPKSGDTAPPPIPPIEPLPAEARPAEQPFAPTSHRPSGSDDRPLWAPQQATLGDTTIERDRLRRAATPAPLPPPPAARPPNKGRGLLLLAAVAGVAIVAGGLVALALAGGDDNPQARGDGDGDDSDGGTPTETLEIDVPGGLTAAESEAGVQLDWDGNDATDYIVLILSENEQPTPEQVTGPSLLIEAAALEPDVGYCFAVASQAGLTVASEANDTEAAFSAPTCIRGAAEDTVLQGG